MTYAAEPYVQFVDDLLTALTGGTIRDEFRFLRENAPFKLHTPSPPIPSTVRVYGQSNEAYRRFQSGRDYRLEPDFTLTWLETSDAQLPDEGSVFFANYEVNGSNPALTDRNPGSVTRLLAESFAREYAVLSKQLEGIYNAGFVETASGRDLDQIGLLVGVERRTATFAIGTVVFFRSTPSPADIFIPAGTRVSTATPPPAQFETQLDATLGRGGLSVEVPIQSLTPGPAGVVAAQAIAAINSPILGIDGVNNPQATAFQSGNETDTQLRERIRRAHERAGQATPGSLIGALTTIPGVREKDIQIVEDPISRPGVIQVDVALPELQPGQEAEMLQQLAEQAVRLIEEARPVGVRILHNIDAPRPTGPGEAGPGVQPDEGDAPAAPGIPPTGSLSLPINVNAWLTPSSRSLSEPQRMALIRAGENTIRSFLSEAGIGETLVYNSLVAQLMALDGVLDVAVEMYPTPDAAHPTPVARRKNIVPIDPALRPVAGKLIVDLLGSLIVLDLELSVTRVGAGLLVDPAEMSLTVATDVTALLNTRFREGALTQLNVTALRNLFPTSDMYTLDPRPQGLSYRAEFQDAGVRIQTQNPDITPGQSDRFWVRRVEVQVDVP